MERTAQQIMQQAMQANRMNAAAEPPTTPPREIDDAGGESFPAAEGTHDSWSEETVTVQLRQANCASSKYWPAEQDLQAEFDSLVPLQNVQFPTAKE